MDNQALGVADVGQVREEFSRIDKALSGLQAALDTEADDAAESIFEIFGSQLVIGILSQAGIGDPRDERMFLEEFSNRQGVFRMLTLAQGKGFEALQELEGVERAHAGAQITQQLHARLEDE